MRLDGSTRLTGVFGAPIRHTASPAMHNAAFDHLGINWAYLAFHVSPETLKNALAGARDLGFVGLNLTVPHKIAALPLMDDLDTEAQTLGAVNTVVVRDGRLHGTNTDGYGFVKALEEEFSLSLKGHHIMILGAGGVGRALAGKCALEQAAKITVANRTPDKAHSLARELAGHGTVCEAVALDAETLARVLPDADLVVNATAVGLQGSNELPIRPEHFVAGQCVLDMIYRPPVTPFLEIAQQAGARVANGLSMLLHQGARAFELWTGEKAPIEPMRTALQQAVTGAPS